jgi:hypothetical protein
MQPSPGQANFTLMTECTPESRRYYSVYSVIHTVQCTVCNRAEGSGSWASDKQTTSNKHLCWSIFKESRHLGFGVFIDIWSMYITLSVERLL